MMNKRLYNKKLRIYRDKKDKSFVNNNLISKLVIIDTDISGRHFFFSNLYFDVFDFIRRTNTSAIY